MSQNILSELLCGYYHRNDELRDQHIDLGNLEFQQKCGLSLKVPEDWCPYNSAEAVIKQAKGQVVIIYPKVDVYRGMYEQFPDAKFVSWADIYVAIHNSSRDMRDIQVQRKTIESADLVVFLGAESADPTVVDHVQAYVGGCLIMLS